MTVPEARPAMCECGSGWSRFRGADGTYRAKCGRRWLESRGWLERPVECELAGARRDVRQLRSLVGAMAERGSSGSDHDGCHWHKDGPGDHPDVCLWCEGLVAAKEQDHVG